MAALALQGNGTHLGPDWTQTGETQGGCKTRRAVVRSIFPSRDDRVVLCVPSVGWVWQQPQWSMELCTSTLRVLSCLPALGGSVLPLQAGFQYRAGPPIFLGCENALGRNWDQGVWLAAVVRLFDRSGGIRPQPGLLSAAQSINGVCGLVRVNSPELEYRV